jgi:pimeloyl-ACP methyl ester carboxylesterase
LKILLLLLLILFSGLWLTSYVISYRIEQKFPPIGEYVKANNARLHFVDTGAVADSSKPAVIFLHGASGNLRDQMHVYRPMLENEFRLVFPDRPGQGYSESFPGSHDPKAQAKSVALLMDELGIEKAVVSGHSFGGVVAAAFGVLYPEKTAGLVLLAPVAYPWGTGVDWHYDVASIPVIGWLFTNLLAVPAGSYIYSGAIERVFAPDPLPDDYERVSGTRLALRPASFLANAQDVSKVEAHVEAFHNRYSEITAPTYIFHGNRDDIVSLDIHSVNGLAKDVPGARLEVLDGVGHKPDYVARDKVVTAIHEIAEGTGHASQ